MDYGETHDWVLISDVATGADMIIVSDPYYDDATVNY